jgi:hypothetical protein
MTAIAPATSSQRSWRLPCFEILPSLSLPPVECCLGTKPIHAARLRPGCNDGLSNKNSTLIGSPFGVTRFPSLMTKPAWIAGQAAS